MVLGGQGLDELEQWVSDLFSAVPSGKGDRPTFFEAGMPYKVGFCLLLLSSSQLLPHHRVQMWQPASIGNILQT